MVQRVSPPRLRQRQRHSLLIATVMSLAFAVTPIPANAARADAARTAFAPSVHVSGNHLVDGAGQPIRLLGVNRAGSEYACVQGWGVFDGPVDDDAVAAISSWRVNAVRIPLNEDCWLGINGVNASVGGVAYRQAIVAYVALLHRHGLAAILDLHWSAPGGALSVSQQPMPDEDHAPAFWSSVAATFAGDPSVVFDLYNEPHGVSWQCWRDGGVCADVSFAIAGMQQLVDAVRQTGASNVILVGGLAWANDLSKWLDYRPTDPAGNLAAAWHVYNFNACAAQQCWEAQVAPVVRQVPVVAGEIGENNCGHDFIDRLMDWLDTHDGSYLGWSWNVGDCGGFPSLIVDYSGNPSPFGDGLKRRLVADPAVPAPTSATPTEVPPTAISSPGQTPEPTASPALPTAPGFVVFATGFEDGDPQPSWTDTVDAVGETPGGGLSRVDGICCHISGPEAGVRHETAHAGVGALLYSGLGRGTGATYAYTKVFDVSAQHIAVGVTTTLSYWIYPQSSRSAPVPVSGNNSTCVALDLIFTDGNDLRDSGAIDQNGARLHPAYQCARLRPDTWNYVRSVIGTTVAGKSIARIDIGYDQPGGRGGYRGYIDDIAIST